MTARSFQSLMTLCMAVCVAAIAAFPCAAQTETAEPVRHQSTSFHSGLQHIRSAVFNSDSSLLFLGGVTPGSRDVPYGVCLSVWDTATCSEVKRLHLGSLETNEKDGLGTYIDLGCVVLSPDDKWVAAGVGNDIKVLDTSTWRGKTLLRNKGWVLSLAFSPDGKHLLAGCTGSVRLWDLKPDKEKATFKAVTFKGGGKYTPTVAFSADGTRIAFNVATTIEVWNVAKRTMEYKRKGDTVVRFHPGDSNLLFGAKRLWDLKAEKDSPIDPEDPNLEDSKIAFSADAKVKVLYTEKKAKLWLPGEEKPRKYDRESFLGQLIAVSPNGKKLVDIDAGRVTLWDLETILAESKGDKR